MEEISDSARIEQAFQELLQDYLNSNHRKKVERITEAFRFAEKAHRDVKRASGEPYIMHPLAVARICCSEIGLGSTSICAALLHDVVEDTEYTIEDIRHSFGDKIASIVDGLTKISGGIFGKQASTQTENFRRLLLTMSEDIRVILIKMADRLHNMRTLDAMAPSKRLKIAGETLYLYAPLAHRLGLNQIKTELEDLSFHYEHPIQYEAIAKKLASTSESRDKLYRAFTEPLIQELNELGIEYQVKDRVKSVYSIWRKMQNKNLAFEDIYDILAVRVVFELPDNMDEKTALAWEKKKCWDIYSALTNLYKPHPDRLRDWVNTPKANGYQALHTTVMGPFGMWVEVQIRSSRMDAIAERGFAAHWKYKENEIEEDTELNHWIQTIKEILESPEPNALDMLDTIKMNLFSSEIFVFTPKGEIKTMAQGATALDFAFELHSELGYHCIGAKANHQLVPLSYVLKSGDQIEILTSDSQTPKFEWLDFVTTGKAFAKIKARLRRENKILIRQGENSLNEFLNQERLANSPENIQKLVSHFGCSNRDDLLLKISKKEISLDESAAAVFKKNSSNILVKYWKLTFGKKNEESSDNDASQPLKPSERKSLLKSTHKLTEESMQDRRYNLAECCHPIPGDLIAGFLEDDGSITVHKQLCPNLMKLKSTRGNNLITAEWATQKAMSFLAELEVTGTDNVGVLNQITRIVSDEFSVNMTKLYFESKDGIFTGNISLYVHDVDDLNKLCNKIKSLKAVESVSRVENKETYIEGENED